MRRLQMTRWQCLASPRRRGWPSVLATALALALTAGGTSGVAQTPDVASPAAPSVSAKSPFGVAKASTLRLEGDSNVHKWSSSATVLRVTGSLENADAASSQEAMWAAVRSGRPVSAEMRIPVNGLKSGKSKLDANMVKALRGDEHPEIVYRLEKAQVKESADSLVVALSGSLTVAGEKRPHAMTVAIRPAGAGLRMTGHSALKMTDFGIKPPTMMLGTLRTHDDVVVHIDFVLEPGKGGVK